MKPLPSMEALVAEYLTLRRNLGFQMKIEGAELTRFARYAESIGHRGPLTTELAVRWAKLPEKADRLYWARRLDMVRRFAKHRALFDPCTQVPPEGLFGPSYRRSPPHIYSKREIQTFLQAARCLGPAGGLRPHTYATLFGLLACTGLRISEALALTPEDVDLQSNVLLVKESKFKKSRLIPIHPSASSALRRYAARRDKYHPQSNAFSYFLTEFGTSLKYGKTLKTFLALKNKLGWPSHDQRQSPRIHDLRHTFAVNTLLEWYRRNADLERMLPTLTTYLGHVKASDTYWYLTAVPELLAVVGNRFESFSCQEPEDKS